jgi:hypothetical protein
VTSNGGKTDVARMGNSWSPVLTDACDVDNDELLNGGRAMAQKKPDAETWPKILPGGSIYHGLVSGDDPIYQGGWNFIHLNRGDDRCPCESERLKSSRS